MSRHRACTLGTPGPTPTLACLIPTGMLTRPQEARNHEWQTSPGELLQCPPQPCAAPTPGQQPSGTALPTRAALSHCLCPGKDKNWSQTTKPAGL